MTDHPEAPPIPDPRLCPGQHLEDRALRPDEFLCSRCVGTAMRQLEHLEADLLELDTTISRQAVVRHSGSAGRARPKTDGEPDEPEAEQHAALAREIPLPFNERAAKVRTEVEQLLSAWAEFVAEQLGIPLAKQPATVMAPPPTTAAARPVEQRCKHEMVLGTCAVCSGYGEPIPYDPAFIVNVPSRRGPGERRAPRRSSVSLAVLRARKVRNWMRTHDQGPALASTIGYVHRRVRGSIDRFDRRWFAGECGRPTTVVELTNDDDGNLVAVSREATCTADLYAEPGKAIVVCDGYREPHGIGGCGALHPAPSRHKYVIAKLRASWLPLDAILSTVKTLYGLPAPEAGTVRQWRHRGKLRPIVCLVKHWTDQEVAACRACRGEMFLGGQVVDLVLERGKPGPKTQPTDDRISA